MAHCVGHSDFFKQNRMFKYTNPDNIMDTFKAASKYVRQLIEDPSIGIEKVERILDAAHAIKYQVPRYPGIKYKTREEWITSERLKQQEDPTYKVNLKQFPHEPDYNLLLFIATNSRNLEEWERSLLLIVEENSKYFVPQALTKIMNEGWACTIHQKIINELNLPDGLHLPFIKLHNQVVRPHLGTINPYHLGFELFKKIIDEKGFDEALLVRETHNDITFLRTYLDQEFLMDQNLFSYSFKSEYKSSTIDDIADEIGWEKLRDDLISNAGLNRSPIVFVMEMNKDHKLTLVHEHDGRDLEVPYAQKVFNYIKELWGDEIILLSQVEGERWEF
jgi:stage V sporulation protein R